ncbi:hypothetical protein GGR57DRAFT_98559 [Xylariaceae sp. FL1272]|nr:hypothetical protein GGR57DRAFT_98559 [Xylariaceae sp. FL1272]
MHLLEDECIHCNNGTTVRTTIQEQDKEAFADRFPQLCTIVAHNLEHQCPCREWLPFEQALLALAAPPPTMQPDAGDVSRLQDFLTARSFEELDRTNIASILCIHGSSRIAHSVAGHIMCRGVTKLRERKIYRLNQYLSFTFDSRDPTRCSMSDMITSILAQTICGKLTGAINIDLNSMRDIFAIRGGWT